MTKERYQNPIVGDEINLRLFTYNSSNLQDVVSVDEVNIYFLDPNNKTVDNPDGRRLIDTIDGSAVTLESTGTHLITLSTEVAKYTIGKYVDVWSVTLVEDQPAQTIENQFTLYPDLWYTTPIPIVYDFDFRFQPNKFRQGSKQFIIIEIIPNVPRSSDLERYYTNLAIVSDLKITIEQACGNCMPEEEDLRKIIDEESVDYRELKYGYYKFDTSELDCGIYNITFKLEFGDNIYISERMPIQVYS